MNCPTVLGDINVNRGQAESTARAGLLGGEKRFKNSRIVQSGSLGSQVSRISSPTTRRISLSMRGTALLGFTATAVMVCCRAKASNWYVRSADRFAAFLIAMRFSFNAGCVAARTSEMSLMLRCDQVEHLPARKFVCRVADDFGGHAVRCPSCASDIDDDKAVSCLFKQSAESRFAATQSLLRCRSQPDVLREDRIGDQQLSPVFRQ